ncbi:MAG: phosphoglycerate kinase [Cellulomonadaceae bacterium]|jgi:phosphoglycerate kinase|nr:phosphoglycerate kinase [Cellulomonadaceae bacterium]
MKTIESLGDLAGKTVLVRSDFNVKVKDGAVAPGNDGRLIAALPTLNKLLDAGAKVVVTAHLGRPKPGDTFTPDPAFTVKPVAARLSELLGKPVAVADDLTGDSAKAVVAALQPGEIALLENVRMDPRETSKVDADREAEADDIIAATGADAFVSDGFGVVHRKQASVYDVAKKVPAAAGDLVFKEVDSLSKATTDPARPYAVVLGGAKVSDKLPLIANLLDKADMILIGGGMMFTFLKAKGLEVGKSLLEEDQVDTVKGYLDTAAAKGVEFVLPVDCVVAPAFDAAPTGVVAADAIPADQMGLDIGPDSAKLFADKLATAKTIAWNGPMGVFENPDYAAGTRDVAQGMIDATAAGAFSVVGGGDSATAVKVLGLDEAGFSHISTGGGASLELLEGKVLPGIDVLS